MPGHSNQQLSWGRRMASLDEERYLRHLLLLGEGGLFVLRGIVSREATNSGNTLGNLLQNGRSRFTDVLQEQQQCLFPTPTTVNANTNTWDMSLLFVVLKKLFWSGLSLSERAYLSALKTYRNDFQGHPTKMSMNKSEYSNNRQLLETALRQIASGINETAEIEKLIKRTASGRIELSSIFVHIKDIYDFKTSFLLALVDMQQRVNSKLSSIQGNQELILQKLTDLQNKHLRKTKHKYSRELKIIIHAECENEEKQRKANDLLFEFVEMIQRNTAIRSDEIRRLITQRIEWYGGIKLQLLDDLIEWFSDIEDLSDGVGKPRVGSIILPISCSSVTGILTLFQYMNDRQSKQRLSRVSSNVSLLLGFPCSLSWKVEPMSLRSAISSSLLSSGNKKSSKEEKVLVLPINITNIEQLTDIWKMLGDEQRGSNMEKIPSTLSQIFGDEIYVDNDPLQSTCIIYERVSSPGKEKRSKEEKDLVPPINVTNKEQLTDILKMSRDEQRSSNIEKISATLSQIFGEAIRLRTYVDNDQLQSIIYERDFLSMTDVSEVHGISEEEEVNWVKSVLALKITADDAMTYLARSIFRQFFNRLNYYEKTNLDKLLDFAQNRHKDYTLRRVKDHRVWAVNSPECRSLLEKLVSAHWDPAYVEWDNIGDTYVERYWKIAKLYMPHGNKDSTCPEDSDMIAIFHMLKNFKVKDFAEERKEIDEMIGHVNYLLRSPDNKISEAEMSSILENIYQFMKSTELSEDIKSKTNDKLQKVQLISNFDEWYKRILPKQKSDLAFEPDRTNQFLNITEKLLVEFTKENRYTMEQAYNAPLLDIIKGAGRDIGAKEGPASLIYGSTLDATASGTSYIWKSFNENPPPSQSSDEVHKKLMQRKLRLPDIDGGYIKSHPDKSTDGQSSNKEHKKKIQRRLRSSDYNEGDIKSQPDKSTDDHKSPDKEHKKQIQRRLRSSDYDEALLSMADKPEVRGISKEEEVYWVKSVLALQITADDAMTYLAMSIFKQFFDSLTSLEKDNLQNLLDIAQNRHKRYTLKRVEDDKGRRVWEVNAPNCKSLLEKLVSAHWDPAYVEWDNIGGTDVESYWKIAKLYMPHGNKYSTCPEDTDMLAKFHLLRNVKKEDFVEERIEIEEMIRHSKYLIFHSHDNRISIKKMTEIFENINILMESNKLCNDIKSITKERLKKVQLLSNSGNWYCYKRFLLQQKTGLAVELDRTEQFLSISKGLLLVFKAENRYLFAMRRKYDHHVLYMGFGALAGAATGALLGPVGSAFGFVSGAAIGRFLFNRKYKSD